MDLLRYPWANDPAPVALLPPSDPDERPAKRRGRRPAAGHSILPVTTSPDWLYHRLTISGPADGVAGFAAAARGAGIIPWQLDFAALEEDIFVRAIAQPAGQRNLTVEGCRILARQFRARMETRQARAAALLGHSQACPFDLHTLLPVPTVILQLGPTHPETRTWLAAHWGVTDRLRQVVERPNPGTGRRLATHHTAIGYGFFTDGETPQPAIAALGARWPGLRFRLVPRPAD